MRRFCFSKSVVLTCHIVIKSGPCRHTSLPRGFSAHETIKEKSIISVICFLAGISYCVSRLWVNFTGVKLWEIVCVVVLKMCNKVPSVTGDHGSNDHHILVAILMCRTASLVTTSRMQQYFNVMCIFVFTKRFLFLYHCCILSEIKLTTTSMLFLFQYIILPNSWWPHQWENCPRYQPSVRGIHRSPVDSPHKGQWRRALIFSLICASTNGWTNNRGAGDMRHHHAHYDVTVMFQFFLWMQRT